MTSDLNMPSSFTVFSLHGPPSWQITYISRTLVFANLHRGPQQSVSGENKCTVFLLVFQCLFESFRRDLNEAKAVYISEYYLVCRFVITTLRLRLKFRLTSLTINSHRGEILSFHNGRALKEKRDNLTLFSFSPQMRVNS